MNFEKTDLLKNILNSAYGVFVCIDGRDLFLDSSSDFLDIERVERRSGSDVILQTRIRNRSGNSIKIYSFVVSDFVLTKSFKVRKILENGWLQCSEVSYKSLDEETKKNSVFLIRDQNPLSFEKEYGYVEGSIISEWFTSIIFNGSSLVIGAVTTADQFSQIFVKRESEGVRVRVTSQYDGLILNPGQSAFSEKIFFSLGEEEKTLKRFALSLAKHMNVRKTKNPIKAMCCSYYWNGNTISEKIINNELDAIKSFPERLSLDYFQLDAGYTRYFGDWLDHKERFPNGFEPIVKRIKDLGYKPGIWLSPYAINPATRLHKNHKGWFLDKDRSRDHLKGRATSPIDTLLEVLDLEVLDPTKKEVQEYLKEVLSHFKNLGFELFKLDFMYPACLTLDYSIPVTRAKALRIGLELIRDTVGENSHILTAITPMSPIVGIADSARMGIDTLNPFICSLPGIKEVVNNYMLTKNIEENKKRIFLNGVVWVGDPDCLVFRDGTGIDDSLIEKHKNFAKENKMSLWIGDSFARLNDKEKMKVVRFFNEKIF